MMNYAEMKTKNGYFEHDGKVYVLLEQAYRTGTNENPRFEAPAVIEGSKADEDGWMPCYLASWEITADYEDDSFNADWDSLYDVKEYGEYNVHERRLI